MQEFIYKIKHQIRFLKHNFDKLMVVAFLSFVFLFLIFLYQNNFANRELKISFLNVGQGDAIFIETPSGKKILVDAGASEKVLSELSEEVSIFDKEIDMAIMSHADQDHVGGFVSLFKKYNFKKVIWNGDEEKSTDAFLEIKKYIDNKKLEDKNNLKEESVNVAKCGDEIDMGDGVMMYVLSEHKIPPAPEGGASPKNKTLDSKTDSNSKSIVLLLTYLDYSVLLTGDATQEVERKIFFNINKCFGGLSEETQNLKSKEILEKLKHLTILKSSHHGSDTGNSLYLLKNTKPTYTIISVGKDNTYNLPNDNTISRIKKYSKYILRTDEVGRVTFRISEAGFEIEKEK